MRSRCSLRRLGATLLVATACVGGAGSSSTVAPAARADVSGGLEAGDGLSPREAAPAPHRTPKKSTPRADRPAPTPKRRRPSGSGRPVLSAFAAAPGRFFLYGAPARVSFRITDASDSVHVRLEVLGAGNRRIRSIDLGRRRTGRTESYRLTGREGGTLPQGALALRLRARDPAGRSLRPSAKASGVDRLGFYHHRMPVVGNFGFGGDGSRFGAGRPGHVHQGQDIPAPEGTPLVAPRGGRVRVVADQPAGAGHYVILSGAGERREYAFFHMQAGSIRVRPGQIVRTGQRLGNVGNTGASLGAHLHFEIWDGPWQGGGRPIDPLPALRQWNGWS